MGKRCFITACHYGLGHTGIEDNPILSADLLNAVTPGVFRPKETLEIVREELPIMDMLRLWEVLPHVYQISVNYLARNLIIESNT